MAEPAGRRVAGTGSAEPTTTLPLTPTDVEPTAPLPQVLPAPQAPAPLAASPAPRVELPRVPGVEDPEDEPTGDQRAAVMAPAVVAAEPTPPTPRSAAQPGGGRRRATKQPRARRPVSPVALLRTLPSAPVVAGLAALAVSVGGAVSVADSPVSAATAAPAAEQRLQKVGALTGTGAVATTNLLAERKKVVSRDASREDAEEGDDEIVEAAEEMSQERTAALARFAKQAEKQAKVIELNQWVLPLSGYRLSAHFGASSGLWASTHTGLDFAASYGAPIRAVAGGVVTEVGWDGSYGNKTVVTLDDGTEIWYAHQSRFGVSVGQEVRSGDVIGYVGSTGNSTGNHLHLEVRPGAGDPVDPYGALVVHGLQP